MKKTSCSSIKGLILGAIVCLLLQGHDVEADFTFGEPTKVPNVNSTSADGRPQISRDGLELYFTSHRERIDGESYLDIWVSKRSTTKDPWSTPIKLDAPANSAGPESSPSISSDGLELYFADGFPSTYIWSGSTPNPNGYGHTDLWVSTRASKDDPWDAPKNLGPTINSENAEDAPCISADGLELYFMSDSPGGSNNPRNSEIFVTTRPTKDDPWGKPVNLGSNVNSDQYEYSPFVSSDGLSLFFGRGFSKSHIHVCRRTATTDPWGPAEFFAPVNSGNGVFTNDPGNSELYLSFSEEDSTLYFARGTTVLTHDWALWQVEVTPIVDFNLDGIVDVKDVVILTDRWGENYPLCDIGPMPWGDGIVDVQDMIVLSEHLLPSFPAHWELDETEGSVAYDSAGDHDSKLNGNPLWNPVGGKVNGSLQLDGIDDYISTPYILDTLDGSFSAFAWILALSSEPGQVIISQTDGLGYGAAWLSIDSTGEKLMTNLMDPQPALESETIITDYLWHHIGLVWDGSYRYLYVDGAEVAKDVVALSYAMSCDGGLYLGAGKDLDTDSFFSGLIDDVRIYRRALSAEEIAAMAQ
ncbi:LamG-like jellyroll fold domain-containing protein [Planctomycetota bacterium]